VFQDLSASCVKIVGEGYAFSVELSAHSDENVLWNAISQPDGGEGSRSAKASMLGFGISARKLVVENNVEK
jgi:hypothetical protein